MTSYKAPDFQERAALSRQARQKALDQLRARPAATEAELAAGKAARLEREAAEAEQRRLKQAAREAADAARHAEALAVEARAAEAAAASCAARPKPRRHRSAAPPTGRPSATLDTPHARTGNKPRLFGRDVPSPRRDTGFGRMPSHLLCRISRRVEIPMEPRLVVAFSLILLLALSVPRRSAIASIIRTGAAMRGACGAKTDSMRAPMRNARTRRPADRLRSPRRPDRAVPHARCNEAPGRHASPALPHASFSKLQFIVK